jgi:NADH-quinone oxidoreductase subunit F
MAFRELLLKGADTRDLTRLPEYEAVGGYRSLRKAIGMDRQAVLDELLAADVRGRGGAGFPMGRKASFLPKPEDTAKPIYLVVNADESEPGTFKDREIMLRVPHLFIEGVFIAAYTIGSSQAFIYLRGEYLSLIHISEPTRPY